MTRTDDVDKVAEFQAALNQLIERVAEDRYVLAIVLVGSLAEETIWHRETLGLWIIEADGVSRRLPSDGTDERVFRILVENGINIHAEVILRSRFKKMVEGASRTAFSCNFFAIRQVVYSKDPSIDTWFKQANSVATKDRERELLTFSTWTIYAHRHARKRLDVKGDLELAAQEIVWAAHSVAHTEIIRQGQVWEQGVIYRAIDGAPELFQTIYLEVLAKRKNRRVLSRALDQARRRGFTASTFSFNVKGGRCEECGGEGTITTQLSFMPDVEVLCPTCKGARYNQDTLEVKYQDKNIAEVLDMSVEDGALFFANEPTIARKISVLNELGLGYLKLGHPSTIL